MNIHLRKATTADVPGLREVIEASVRGLQARIIRRADRRRAQSVYGVDSQLIADGTYLVAEVTDRRTSPRLSPAAAGASAKLCMAAINMRDAKIRCSIPHAMRRRFARSSCIPNWARRGIGSLILEACEEAAREAGFTRLEMGATLSGVAFYKAKGYAAVENQQVPLGNGETLPIVRMAKKYSRINGVVQVDFCIRFCLLISRTSRRPSIFERFLPEQY